MVDNMMKVRFVSDLTGINALDAGMQALTNEAIRETMEDIHTMIMSRWSEISPSAPGQPPAVVTGTLGSSIHWQPTNATGQFASGKDAVAWSLRVEAEYGAALEFGVPERNLEPRPFLRPALDAAKDALGNHIKEKLTFATSKYEVKNPFSAQRIYTDEVIGAMG